MGLTAMGFNKNFTNNITLAQIFASISITLKSFEKTVGFDKMAKKWYLSAQKMRALLRTISILELKFYTLEPLDKNIIVNSILEKIEPIWEGYDNLEYEILIQPPETNIEKSN